MLHYDRINVHEGINVNKISKLKSVIFVTIGNFLSKGFKFQPLVCNRCYDLLMMPMNLAILLFQKIKMLIIVILLVEFTKVKL